MKINWFKIRSDSYFIALLYYIIYGIIELDLKEINYRFNLLLVYLKQGQNCKDCEKKYWYCDCFIFKEFINIRFKTLSFIKYNLSGIMKEKLIDLIYSQLPEKAETIIKEINEFYEN